MTLKGRIASDSLLAMPRNYGSCEKKSVTAFPSEKPPMTKTVTVNCKFEQELPKTKPCDGGCGKKVPPTAIPRENLFNDVGGKVSFMASIEGHRKPMHPLFSPLRSVTIHTQADSRAPKPSMTISNLEEPFKEVRHRFVWRSLLIAEVFNLKRTILQKVENIFDDLSLYKIANLRPVNGLLLELARLDVFFN